MPKRRTQSASNREANIRPRLGTPLTTNSTPASNSASSTTSYPHRQGDVAATLLNTTSFQAIHQAASMAPAASVQHNSGVHEQSDHSEYSDNENEEKTGEMLYETQSRIRKLLSEFLIGMKFPEVFRCSGKTVSDDRVFRQKFIAAFKESVSAEDLADMELWTQVHNYFYSKIWPLFLDVRCGFTSFIKKHFREVFHVFKFDFNQNTEAWKTTNKDLLMGLDVLFLEGTQDLNHNRSLRDNSEIWVCFDQLLRRVCKTNHRGIIPPTHDESEAPQQTCVDSSNNVIAEEARSFKAVHEIYTVSDEAYVRLTIVNYLKCQGSLKPLRDMILYSYLQRKVIKERENKRKCNDAHEMTEAYHKGLLVQGSNVPADLAVEIGRFRAEV